MAPYGSLPEIGEMMRIGVDLGGTKIEFIALGDDGDVLVQNRVSTPKRDYQATIAAIRDGVSHMEGSTGQSGSVGIGIPGAVSPATGRIKNANSTWLIGEKLDTDLENALQRPVRLANDANCFTLSEAVDGAARGAEVVFGVILGTGVGGGLVIKGSPVTGPNAIAGEWGHNPLPWPDPSDMPGAPCYCGQSGCIETHLSGPALSNLYLSATGHSVEASDVAARADQSDPNARQVMADYESKLARALASVINILDPDVIVLGGGLSNIAHLYDAVPTLWQEWVFSDSVMTPLLKPRHGDSSGVRGAARLWPA